MSVFVDQELREITHPPITKERLLIMLMLPVIKTRFILMRNLQKTRRLEE